MKLNPETLATMIVDVIAKAMDGPRVAHRFTVLESRIQALEARPGVEYGGAYENAKAYPKGVLVSRKGGLWLSLQDENGWAPGQSPQHWKLVVKSREAEG